MQLFAGSRPVGGRSMHIQWYWFAALEGRHSYRSATIGSTFAARRAGI
jgi:hypothetical protein